MSTWRLDNPRRRPAAKRRTRPVYVQAEHVEDVEAFLTDGAAVLLSDGRELLVNATPDVVEGALGIGAS